MALSFLRDDAPRETIGCPESAEYGPAPAAPETTALVKADPFDPAPIADLFNAFTGQITAMAVEASAVKVTDEATKDRAVTMIGQVKQVAGAIEKKRKEVKAPYFEMGKTIDGFANPLVASLKNIENQLSAATKPYLVEQDRKRREFEAEARRQAEESRRQAMEEAARRQAEAEKLATESGETAPPPEPVFVPPIIPVAASTISARTVTETATAGVEREWVFDITNMAELLKVETMIEARAAELEKAVRPWINAQVKAGVRSIAGVAIYQTEKLKTRARR